MKSEKQFIPYEQALILKELGFNENCFGLYHNDKTFYPTQCKSQEEYHGQICSAHYINKHSNGLERSLIYIMKYY